jgi:hypothetical protein
MKPLFSVTFDGPAYQKKWRAEHREHMRDYAREWKKAHPDVDRKRNLMRYGLTIEAFSALLLEQGGVCASCGTSEFGSRGPNVDHDHVTGNVRGILCSNCNCAAGFLKDDPALAKRLATYLEKQYE